MAATLSIDASADTAPIVHFPQHCMRCAAPSSLVWSVSTTGPARSGRPVLYSYDVPVCEPCRRGARQVTTTAMIGLLAGFVVGAPLLYLGTLAVLDEYGPSDQVGNNSLYVYVVAALVALVGGLGVGTLVEAMGHVALLPFVGRRTFESPLNITGILGSTVYAPGLTMRYDRKSATLRWHVRDPGIAAQFVALNQRATRT